VATPPGVYKIRLRGRLGVTALSAFPTMEPELRGNETVLTGQLADQSALFGVLAQIEALGLELLEVRRSAREERGLALGTRGTGSPASGEDSSPEPR
jgi:hypothetical protein